MRASVASNMDLIPDARDDQPVPVGFDPGQTAIREVRDRSDPDLSTHHILPRPIMREGTPRRRRPAPEAGFEVPQYPTGHTSQHAGYESGDRVPCAMVKIRPLEACRETGLFWESGTEVAKCASKDHQHQQFEVHTHLDLVTLPDGTPVTAASFDFAGPYLRHPEPDFGLYLDPRWQPPWNHAHIDWPDFGLPEDADAVRRSLTAIVDRARSGQRVELGYMGGHGRTGTALVKA